MRLAALILALLLPFSTWASEFDNEITGYPQVSSGHQLVINGVKVQIWGIEALPPETPVGRRAQQALEGFVKDRRVRCLCQKTIADAVGTQCVFIKKSPGWHMARCLVGNLDLGSAMVTDGWAVNHDRFTSEYQGDEDFARMRCIGMFSGEMCGIYESRYTH